MDQSKKPEEDGYAFSLTDVKTLVRSWFKVCQQQGWNQAFHSFLQQMRKKKDQNYEQ